MSNEMPPSGSPSPELPLGTLVTDREASDTDLALVLDHPDDRCDVYLVEGTDQTVSDYNPEYPEDAPVTIVVFVPALEDHLSNWRRQPLDTLRDRVAEVSIQTYSYPVPRLEATGELLDDPIQM